MTLESDQFNAHFFQPTWHFSQNYENRLLETRPISGELRNLLTPFGQLCSITCVLFSVNVRTLVRILGRNSDAFERKVAIE